MRQRTRRGAPWLIGTLILLLGACEERRVLEPEAPGVEPLPFTLTGSWEGTAAPVLVTVSIGESTIGELAGSGAIRSEFASYTFSVVGLFATPDVAMQFQIPGEEDIAFRGVLTTDFRIVGTLNGAGFEDFGLTLRRLAGGDSQQPTGENGNAGGTG